MESKKVQLKSSDNKIFEVPVDILKKAKLISESLDEASEGKEIIFLREVDSFCLEKTIKYLEHYKDIEPKEIPKPFPERTEDDFLRSILNDDWTFDFLQQFNLEDAISIVNAANYLEIDELINILAAKLAHEMCNCDAEEARRKFGIERDCDTDEEID